MCTLVSGRLPPGLSLSSSGIVSGTTTVPGTFGFAVRIADVQFPGVRGTQKATLTVAPGPLESLTLKASATSVFVGGGILFTILARDAYGNPWTGIVTVSSSNPDVVSVPASVRVTKGSAKFIARGIHPGTAQVLASASGISSSFGIRVFRIPFATSGFSASGSSTSGGFTSGGSGSGSGGSGSDAAQGQEWPRRRTL